MDLAYLNIIYPDGRRSALPVTKGSFVIGREPGSDVVLDDRAVSRQHARLVQSNTGWKIVDLGSANGTYVEGERLFTLDTRRLQNNMTIRIGGSALTFQLIPEELADVLQPVAAPDPAAGVLQPVAVHAPPDDHAALLEEMAGLLALPDVPAPSDEPQPAFVETPQTVIEHADVLAETAPPALPLPPVAAPLLAAEFDDDLAALLPRAARAPSALEQTSADAANDGAAALAALAPAAPASDGWQIVINYSSDHTRVQEIRANPYAIGRAENNHLRLDDASIALHHVRLTYRGDSWRILDLGSATGTRVNNEPIPPQTTHVLDDGAVFQLGHLRLALRKQVWQLRVVHRSGRQQTIELNSSPFGIGNASDNKLELTESSIANYHAELVRDVNAWCILDLGSDEGTYVDGVRLLSQYPQPLNEGSSIQIGETTIVVRIGISTPQPTSVRPRLTMETLAPEPIEAASTVAPSVEPPAPVEVAAPVVVEVPTPAPNVDRPGWFRRLVGGPTPAPQPHEIQTTSVPSLNNDYAAPVVAPVPVVAPQTRQESVAPPSVAPVAVAQPTSAAPPPSQGPSTYRKINNIGVVRYWRLRAMRATVVFVGNTVGIYRLQSLFSRTFGFIPRWLVSAGDVDTWNARLDTVVNKPPKRASAAPPAPRVPPATFAPHTQNGTAGYASPVVPAALLPADEIASPSNAAILNAQSALLQTELEKLATNAQTHVLISPDQLMVDPGAAVAAIITVFNRSTIVDRITITITGLPEAWVTITPRSFSLFPGTHAEAQLLLRPPRGPTSLAGNHHFAVIGLSEQSPREHVFAQAVLTITPYAEFRLDLRPQQQAGWRQAAYRLELVNHGNRAQTYQLQGRDEEDLMDFLFTPTQPVINPGETAYVRLQTRLRRRHWFGPAKTSVFFASSAPVNDVSPAQQVVGRFVQQPIFTLVTLAAIVLLLLACFGPIAYRAWTAFFAPLPAATVTAQPTAVQPTAVQPTVVQPTAVISPTLPPSPTALVAPTNAAVIIPPATVTATLVISTPTTTAVAVASAAPTIISTPVLPPTVTPTPPGDFQVSSGTTITITSTNTPNTAYLVYFDDRVITGGSVRANGQIVVELTFGDELPGLHTLVVRERGTSRLLLKKTVFVPER